MDHEPLVVVVVVVVLDLYRKCFTYMNPLYTSRSSMAFITEE